MADRLRPAWDTRYIVPARAKSSRRSGPVRSNVSHLMQNSVNLENTICIKYGSEPTPPHASDKVGIALQTLHLEPLNALRHHPENGTCGWYVWGGEELSSSPDFFQPLHFSHLIERVPNLVLYLSLAPGWRVLLAHGQEDVWFDQELIQNAG